jgi:reactive intermediate/imine deaminase
LPGPAADKFDDGGDPVTREVIRPPNVHPATGYSHAWKVGNTIYVAGQVAVDREGRLVGPGDFEAQAVQVFENLKAVLEAAGAGLEHVVKTTVFLTHFAHRDKFREVRARYFKEPFPASTLVFVESLAQPDWLIEVEAIAVVD